MKLRRSLVVLLLVLGVFALAPGNASAAPAVTSVSPGGGVNTGPSQITVTGSGFVSGSKVELIERHPFSGDVETVVATSGGTVSSDGTKISGVNVPTTGLPPTFDASPPTYSGDVSWFVRVTNPDSTSSISPEFKLRGEAPSLETVSPVSVKQGETKTFTLGGTNFAQRASFSINNPGFPQDPISISGASWKSLTRYTIQITVPGDYPTGKRNLTLTNTDGQKSTCVGCFQVERSIPTKVPTIDSISPADETNASSKDSVEVTIVGGNFNDLGSIEATLVGYCASSGCGMGGRSIPVTITSVDQGSLPTDDDTIVGTVDLADEAPGPYSVRVSNTGTASGSATMNDAFEIFSNPPGLSSPSNAAPQSFTAGETRDFTVEGSNFAKGDTVVIPDATVVQVAFVDRSTLAVTARADNDAETGRRSMTVRHTNGNQASCSQCIHIEANTPAVDKYIDAVFQLFVDRSATSSDLSRWRSTVQRGNRDTLTRFLANSDEFAGVQIDLLYRKILGRASDRGGRTYWLEQVRNGTRLDEIASFFYGSHEYFTKNGSSNRSFVRALYRDILGRTADTKGENHWTAELDAKRLTRSGVAASFYAGIESRRGRVVAQYQLVLGRKPDVGGRDYWAEQIRTLGDLVLASFLAASDEFYNKVT